ncbi:putative nuclease HARBI1 [Sitodiplosis mosellana]|uniref:putative nuclease HARBI1 n=1 Tax=Sitodiplosis mosellana TaxID=263140 RepID=UPI002444A81F|nr:putative nuclease HARBI1 [Sitodiplosis mosellana]
MAWIIPLEYSEDRNRMRIIRKYLRDVMNPFDLSENLFCRAYRIPKLLVHQLIEEIRPFAQNIGLVPLHLQVLSVLNFYATGGYQMSVGSHAFHNLSQTMMSRYVSYYSHLITQHLAPKYIRFPRSVNQMAEIKTHFEAQYHFPGILGVIDGTHIALTALPLEIENAFVNRKGYHSINTQIVCDANMLIININARFPGSTHDSFIFGGSMLHTRLEELHQNDPATFNFLLGDSAYSLSPWLMKIFDGNNLSAEQEHFNHELCAIRQIVERTIGLLKVRFRCILGDRKLRYKPTKICLQMP